MKRFCVLAVLVCTLGFTACASAALPAGVTLQPIDGGANYYCSHSFTQACNAGWDSSSFFPIGPFWGSYVGEQSTWNTEGWNTEFFTTSQSDTNALGSDGKYSIPAASVTPNADTVGLDAADEPSSWSAATSALSSTANAQQGSRLWYINNTWNMLEYGPPSGTPGGTQSAFFTDPVTTPNGSTRHFDSGSVDEYWFALATSGLTYNSLNQGGIQYGLSGAMPASEAKCGCRYGDMIRDVFGTSVGLPAGHSEAGFQTANPAPIFSFVEDGDAFNGNGTGDPGVPVTITPREMNWAVWSSIVHGARGIIWFDHGGCPTGAHNEDNYVLSSCATTIQPGTTISTDGEMTAIDSTVESYAPQINSPTALGYETVTPSPSTFGGIESRAVYDAVNNSFYVFADTRNAETTTGTSATFDTAGNFSGHIHDDQGRTLTVTNGTFTDVFGSKSLVHIYGPIPNQ